MFWIALLLFSALPVSFAGDDMGWVFCSEEEPDTSVCYLRVSDSCYACLHPIEAACGNESQDPVGFANCYCTFPNQSWNGIEQCLNDPTTGCVSDQLDQTLILNAYGVECDTSARHDLWHSEVCSAATTDPVVLQLVDGTCDGNV